MSCEELQQEEIEVLKSIYDGDECFKMVNDVTFQYKICNIDDSHKSFLLEIIWVAAYPNEKPKFNMDTFYNKHIVKEVKDGIMEILSKQAEENVGCAMTYTLFEWAKENQATLMANQPDSINSITEVITSIEKTQITNQTSSVTKEKKVQMTKAQKRKMFDRLDAKGERPRGWDWVDVVKHLSQTGASTNSSGNSSQVSSPSVE